MEYWEGGSGAKQIASDSTKTQDRGPQTDEPAQKHWPVETQEARPQATETMTFEALKTLFLEKTPAILARNLNELFKSFDARDQMKNPLEARAIREMLVDVLRGSDSLDGGKHAVTLPSRPEKMAEEYLTALFAIRSELEESWGIRVDAVQEIGATEAQVGLAAVSKRNEIEEALRQRVWKLRPIPRQADEE